MLKFSDGVNVDTSGPLRVLRLSDGLYVVGEGCMIPCDSPDECDTILMQEARKLK